MPQYLQLNYAYMPQSKRCKEINYRDTNLQNFLHPLHRIKKHPALVNGHQIVLLSIFLPLLL